MKMKFYTLFFLIVAPLLNQSLAGQCLNSSNLYSFNYNDKTYEIVRENKTWTEAVSCALERGGYLAEINSQAEQEFLFTTLKSNALINLENTTAFECGSCAFVWIGGSDIATEGSWYWDGDNDGSGTQFWMGDLNGSPVGNLYNNWGMEPDNYNNQDGLGLALNNWIFGIAGQWNDLALHNDLYYVIEYDMILGVEEFESEKELIIYPNPAQDQINIINRNSLVIQKIELFSVLGQKVKTVKISNQTYLKEIEIGDLKPGIYVLNILLGNGDILTKKMVKQ